MEAVVNKLMLAVGMLAAVVLLDPMGAFGILGPQASWLGWKINKAIEAERVSAHTAFFRR